MTGPPGESTARTHVVLDPSDLHVNQVYKLLIGSVLPRPIAWVSSLSRDGVPNLAPFSFFTIVSCDPPMAAIVIGPHEYDVERPPKDTIVNIEATGDFVVNVVSVELGRNMAVSSRETERDLDEFVDAGVTASPGAVVRSPRVTEAGISMECVLETVLRPGSDDVVIGRIVRFHIREDLLLPNGRLDIEGLDPLGRLAGDYASIGQRFELPETW
jgi:flavin reductase (DIM6/NTAB) family NADH-FMN oxidoreductase RutF